jgi:hypothetical protein
MSYFSVPGKRCKITLASTVAVHLQTIEIKIEWIELTQKYEKQS